MGEGKLLWILALTVFFHSVSPHGNSEGRPASPWNSCFVDDDEECDATVRGFNGSIVGFPGSPFRPLPSRRVFNVEDYGAKGDGTDDSQGSYDGHDHRRRHLSTKLNLQNAAGDDCISIVSGSRRVIATRIVCGPGHGIRCETLLNFNLYSVGGGVRAHLTQVLVLLDLVTSIGSLGANNTRAHVSKVLVDKVVLKGTTNGVRIKTWQVRRRRRRRERGFKGGHGYAKHIIFQNVFMHDVRNPIVINQNYCDSRIPCHEQVGTCMYVY
ncbi:hypothetical protein B296_00057600 [Ensete ventricosum]|uniref:Pectate lyase domain-containing protein n=1 Tax=Ensete ventricosum TaxID=4639 RepID=A0A426XMV4_ENSVE|nr:hypothetical protein B296_00057600 [Ensete ventricosum]